MEHHVDGTASTSTLGTSARTLGEALDDAPLSFFHLKAAVTAAMGFFTDAYDLFIIGVALVLIKGEWHLSAVQTSFLGSATLIATLVGALVFGRLADILGRKRVYGLVAAIMALGALATAGAPNYVWLVIFRLVLVIGPVVALTLLASGVNHVLAWRIMLGLGAIPALSVVYLRSRMPESPRFAAQVQGREAQARADIERYSQGVVRSAGEGADRVRSSLRRFLSTPRTLLLILGTAGSWFLLDYVYYGNTISAPVILAGVAPKANLMESTAWTLILFALFAVPGYILALLTIDRIGHRRLQWIGFLGMAASFAIIGFIPGMTHVIAPFLLMYGVSYFFTEFGPNVTTFVIPTEVYGVGERTTGHGISAGIGKLGAFLGVFLFPLLSSALGLGGVLIFCSGLGLAGAALTRVLPEPSGISLDAVNRAVSPTLVAEPAA